MAKTHLSLTLASLVAGFVACGGGGGGKSPTPTPEPEPAPQPDPGLPLATPVTMNAMSYKLPEQPSCLRKTRAQTLPKAPDGLVLDGKLADWSALVAWLDDPAGDAPVGHDLGPGFVARSGEDLIVALTAKPAPGAALVIELGGVVTRQGTLHREVRRTFRVRDGVMEEKADAPAGDGVAAWSPIPAGLAAFAVGDDGLEARLSSRLLGDAMTWPLWWVRTEARAGDTLLDSSEAAYFPSILGSDTLPYKLSTCDLWTGRRLAVQLVEIQDAAATRDGSALDVDQIAERAAQLARAGFDAATAVLGNEPLPVARFVVQSTHAALAPLAPAAAAEVGALLHRGFVLNLADLVPGGIVAFPEGPVVTQIARSVIDLALFSRMPAAPEALRRAFAVALADHMARATLGLSYWIDHLPPRAAADGLGHLLGNRFEPAVLRAAWSAAATAGGDPVDAVRLALGAAAADQALIDRLWQGWLVTGAHDPAFAPDSLLDRDSDGLPNDYEIVVGTNPALFDTDADGWSDAAELVAGHDPTSQARTPAQLMPDGSFDDWLELLPKRVHVDRGRSGRCPKAADIDFFGALATRDDLIIGAVAAEFWENEPAAKWEAVLDFTAQNRQLLVTAAGGALELDVKDGQGKTTLRTLRRGIPMARKSIEWVMSRHAFGLESYFNAQDAVRIRLRTVFKDGEQDLLCDETDWFSPNVSQL